jgi:hypothetical protein
MIINLHQVSKVKTTNNKNRTKKVINKAIKRMKSKKILWYKKLQQIIISETHEAKQKEKICEIYKHQI